MWKGKWPDQTGQYYEERDRCKYLIPYTSTHLTKRKLEGFHPNVTQGPFQNTLQNLFASTQVKKSENWKAFTGMATKYLFNILYQINL